MSVHIVTTALIPGAAQAAAPADEPLDGAPFTALLDEQMQAAHEPAGLLSEKLIDDQVRQPTSDDQSESAPEAIVLAPAFVVETPREHQSLHRPTGHTLERTQVNVASGEARHVRTTARVLPAASGAAAAVTPESTETPAAASRGAASFDLSAVAQAEAPSPSTATQALAAQQAVARTAVVAVHTLQQPVGSERWTGELGHTVQILVRAEQQSATLHVTPPELGPIDVKIDMSGDQASVSFTVQNADTRNALESALPRLRDMLAEGGIALGDTQVNQQSSEQREATGQFPSRGGERATAEAGEVISAPVHTRVGLVDTFA